MSNIEVILKTIFKKLNNESYVVVKLNDTFPQVKRNEDIDIFCLDLNSISKVILEELNKLLINYTIKVNYISGNQVHIDLVDKQGIVFRFDLYQSLPKYNNILLKECLFNYCVENYELRNIDDFNVKVPNKIYESIIRYIEYQEYYAIRGDKIKHIDYIISYLSEEEKREFLNKVHYFTEIPLTKLEEKSKNFIYDYVYLFKTYFNMFFNKVKEIGLKNSIKLAIKRVFNDNH